MAMGGPLLQEPQPVRGCSGRRQGAAQRRARETGEGAQGRGYAQYPQRAFRVGDYRARIERTARFGNRSGEAVFRIGSKQKGARREERAAQGRTPVESVSRRPSDETAKAANHSLYPRHRLSFAERNTLSAWQHFSRQALKPRRTLALLSASVRECSRHLPAALLSKNISA